MSTDDYLDKVEEVDCKANKKDKAIICICQPQWEIDDWTENEKLLFIIKNVKNSNEFIKDALGKSKKHNSNVIVFPELSVPESSIPMMVDWSKQYSTIIIAGSHYHRTDKGDINRSPIIIEGETYYSEKLHLSVNEKPVTSGSKAIPGNKFLVFKNTSIGDFVVFICSDYREPLFSDFIIKKYNPDVVFIPSFQKSSQEYHDKIQTHCQDAKGGVYIVYCNNVLNGFGDGNSAFFGIMNKTFKDGLRGNTDFQPKNKLFQFNRQDSYAVITTDLNNKRPSESNTVGSEPNVFIVFPGIEDRREKGGELKDLKSIENGNNERELYIPNPEITAKVKDEVRKILEDKTLKPFRDELVRHLKEFHTGKADIDAHPEQALVDMEVNKAVLALDITVGSCFKALKTSGTSREILKLIWEKCEDIVGYIVLLSVNYDFSGYDDKEMKQGMRLDIPVVTPAGIEIMHSSRTLSKARLTTDLAKTKVYGKNGLHCPKKEEGWDDNDLLQAVKMDLWIMFYTIDKKEAPAYIDTNKTRTLNARIASRNSKSESVYVTIPQGIFKDSNEKDALLVLLKQDLPDLHTVVVTVGSQKDGVCIVSEPELEGYLLEFFQNRPE